MNHADRIHVGVESKKIGFRERNLILGDPEYVDVDVEKILSEENINVRSKEINIEKANNEDVPPVEGSDTTYFLVADAEGNAVSWIQSVFHGFGSSWVIPGTGIVLNNRLTGFSLNPHSPNFIQLGKRPAHTLNAWLATREDGSLYLVGGTPGANIQVQTNLQLIVNVVDLGMNVQEAIESPRWQHLSAFGQSSLDENGSGVLEIEDRVGSEIVEDLRARGHEIAVIGSWAHGSSVQLLEVSPTGTYMFGSDPRCEGLASGI
jgi:gamma-glutamyltranspeptidase/glutathione hydrolase